LCNWNKTQVFSCLISFYVMKPNFTALPSIQGSAALASLILPQVSDTLPNPLCQEDSIPQCPFDSLFLALMSLLK
jgi:hypothetical protein